MSRSDVFAGRYIIERLAASGGMGTLYAARDRTTGARVALKVLREARSVSRFSREARMLRWLDHPAIVRYLDHGTDEHARPYLVMEWLEGPSFETLLRDRGFRPDEALALARRIV